MPQKLPEALKELPEWVTTTFIGYWRGEPFFNDPVFNETQEAQGFLMQSRRVSMILRKPLVQVMKDRALFYIASYLTKKNLEVPWLKKKPDFLTFATNNPPLPQKWSLQ